MCVREVVSVSITEYNLRIQFTAMTFKQTIKRLLLFVTYVLLFAAIMQAVERTDPDQKKQEKQLVLQNLWMSIQRKYNMTREEFNNITRVIHQAQTPEDKQNWTYPRTVMFMVVLCTTIGYGNMTPKTQIGRALTIIIALFGIPLTLITLNSIGAMVTNSCTKAIFATETRLLKHTAVKRMNIKVFILVVILLMMILFFGALALTSATRWTYSESFYFWFVTLSTVGFGDYVIGSERVTAGMDGWATLFIEIAYIILTLMGLAILASVIDGAIKLTGEIRCRWRLPCCFMNDIQINNEQQ